jgi:hypothetical protein
MSRPVFAAISIIFYVIGDMACDDREMFPSASEMRR